MNTQGNRIRKCWRVIAMMLIAAASFGIAGSRASAQDDLCERITTSMKYEGQGCCWQFVISNNQSSQWISSVMANVLTPGATVASASGPYGVPATTTSSILWNFPNNLPPNGTQTGLTGCFSGSGAVTVELLYLSQGRVLCRDTVTFDCPQAPQGCFRIAEQKAECITLPTGQGGYLLTFMVQNQSAWPASSLALSAPGVAFSPNPVSFSPAIAPGGWAPVSVTITGAAPGPIVINGVFCDSTRKRCCESRFELVLPKCQQQEECFKVGQKSVLCRYNQNNGIEFVATFNIFNLAPWPATYLSFSAPGLVFTPATVVLGVIPSGSWSPMQTLVISGPGAVPGATVSITVTMCDRSRQRCCTQTLTFTLPDDCKPQDCCSDFRKGVKASSSASANGTVSLSGSIGAVGTGGSPIVKVEATLASVSINGAPVYGYFQYGSSSNPFGTASGTPAPYGHEVIWPAIPAGVPMNTATPFTLKMTLPPMAWPRKRDTVRYCVRFRFTDKNCVTCDTLICYTSVRNMLIILDPTHLRGEQDKRENGRSSQSAGEGASISGALHGTDSGSIDLVFPAFPEGLQGGAYVGLAIETEGVNLADVRAMQGGYEFFAANSGAYASFSAAPGSRLSLGLKYDGLGTATALSHRITLSYTVGGDTLSEEFTMVLRREGHAGGDRLAAATTELSGVRTYALHLDNSNGSQEPISRLLLRADGGAKILAVGPTANDSIVELAFGGDGGIGEYGAGGIALAPGRTSGPIYITVAGADSDLVRLHFATLNSGGEAISTGEVILSNPLSSAGDERTGAVAGRMLRQSYPNPAAGSATIGFDLPAGAQVTLTLTDGTGREVARPIDSQRLEAGAHAVYLETATLPEGTYYYTLRAGTDMETRGMQVIR